MVQKNNRFADRPEFPCNLLHRSPPHPNQRTTTDSALYPFVTNFFTRSPCEAADLKFLIFRVVPHKAIRPRVPISKSIAPPGPLGWFCFDS
jgi:hypothetical protein